MWALKRKLVIIFVFLVILSVTSYFIYVKFYKVVPTCFDGIQNGLEESVDCGGVCEEVCSFKATDLNVFWARTFPVAHGVSNMATLIENPNFDYSMEGIFNIKVYDEFNVRIVDLRKKVKLYPAEKRFLFIPSLKTGDQNPQKTFVNFEKINSLVKDVPRDNKLILVSKVFKQENENLSKITIVVKNNDLIPKRNIEVGAVLYAGDGEVLNVGKTFLEYVGAREEKEIYITWPKKFETPPVQTEVFLRIMEDEELLF